MAGDGEIKQLKEIKKELVEIRERTASPKHSFINGVLYGAGALVGGIVAVALIGWILNVLGIIPGFSELSDYVRSLIDQLPRR
ncbi:hypothetical protein JNK62_04555 [bacterium]|nr:hypothetical protein [bacterium]